MIHVRLFSCTIPSAKFFFYIITRLNSQKMVIIMWEKIQISLSLDFR